MGYYLGDTWIEDTPAPSNPLLTDPANAAAIAALKAQYGDITPGRLTNYGEGVTGYEGGRTLQNSKYGLYSGGPNGNVVWTGSEWVPVPEAKDGSLFLDWAGDIAGFAGAAAGAYGLAAGLGGLAGGIGAGSAGAGGVGSINPALAESFAANYAPAAWAAPAGTAAGTAAAGSGAMDFSNLGDLWNFGDTAGGSTLSDLQAAADQFGWSDLASPGTTAGANADIGGSGWLSTIIEQAKADPLGTAAQAVKSVFGNDWMKTIGSLGTAALNAYSSNQQTGALEDMAKRYEGYGAPYRQRLSDLYADPTSFLSSKEVQTPVDLGTQSLMRSLSTQGNPFGSGNALQQGQSYASDQLFSRLGQEKDRLAGFGGLASYNAAAPAAATNAISSGQGQYIGAAKAMGDIFNPPQTPAQQAAEWMKVMGR